MKNLIIVGAGGFGREMYGAAIEAIGYGVEYKIKGFLDDNLDALSSFKGYAPIIDKISTYKIQEDDVFITAFGNLETRKKVVESLIARGAEFISIIHKSAWLGPNVKIGEGSFIANNVVLTADVTIGNHACVFHGSVLGHDVVVGDFSHIYSLCSLCGVVRVGNNVSIYTGAKIVLRKTIGDNSTVGVGSVVILNVSPNSTVIGNPAVPIEI